MCVHCKMVWGAELQRSEHFCAQLESAFELTIITFIYIHSARDVCGKGEGDGMLGRSGCMASSRWNVASLSLFSLSRLLSAEPAPRSLGCCGAQGQFYS